jgi:trimethylamine--corrinoid protein Co-methyltransferase
MKTSNTIAYRSPQFAVLSERQKSDIHSAALEVLRRTGLRFHHAEAVSMLKKAGAFVSDGNLVKFPERLVKQALASAPSRVMMCDRDGRPAMDLEGYNVYYGAGSDCLNLLDPYTGEHRKFVTADLINAYRLIDALPNIHFLMSVGIPTDVDPALTYDVQMALMLEHSTKPIVFVTNDKASCRRAIDMAAAVAGGHEALREQQHILLYSEPSSPLRQSETAIDKLLMMADYELPVVHSPGPQMGAVVPITMAGGLALSVAEILSSLVVHQLRRPGAPFIFGAGLHHMDMSSMQICYASPEFQLTKAAVAEMGRWYGLPNWGYAGCSDAKIMDEQAAVEATLSVIMTALGGSNLVHDVGYMESGLTASLEMFVLTDELAAMANNLLKGIEVTDDTLLLDEIHEVGPGGSYLGTTQTVKRFREFWFPTLLDRKIRSQWLDAGGTTLGQRLNAKVKKILEKHQPKPLAPEKKQKLQEIVTSAKP